jgi:DNA-binding SARP family transcriptional activator
MVRIGVLGPLSLERDGQALSLPVGRPARTLLGWLALHRGTHSRADVAATLWPDVRDDSARGSLRVALVDLRRALGDAADDVVAATRSQVGLRDSPELEVDAWEFAALLAAGQEESALALWRGELLEGLDAGDWLVALRDAYKDERTTTLATLAERAASRGDHPGALRLGRERFAVDPFSEDAARDLMRLLAAAGDRAAALLVYERLAARLRSELRTAPSVPTRELMEAVRDGALETVAARFSGGGQDAEPSATFGLPAARSAFVGRDAEVERLLDLIRDRHRLVMVTGEPGAGKTRLAFELAEALRHKGTIVLFGRCRREPLCSYEPFVEAIRAHVARVGAARVTRIGGLELGRLLPELRVDQPEEPRGDVAHGVLQRLFEGVRTVLEDAAGRQSVVLVLDDLHWADRSTVQLLAYLAVARFGVPVAIIGVARPDDLSPAHPLRSTIAELDRQRHVPLLALGGLEASAIGSILSGVIGATPAPELVDSVLDQTGGNPFFVEQLARHLIETAALLERDGEMTLRGSLSEEAPAGVRALVLGQVERLGDTARRALQLGAVAGAEFSLAVLQGTDEMETRELLEGLDTAAAAGLVTPIPGRPGRWTFRHALIRVSLYEDIPELRRADLHGRIADVLERLGDSDAADVARHAFAARGVDGPDRAVRTSRLAAAEAVTALAYDGAAAHYRRALAALEERSGDGGRERCELLLALGEAQARAADPESDATFLAAADLADTLGDPELVGRAVLGRCGIGVTIVGVDDERIVALQDALQELGDHAHALRSRMLARLAIELYYAPGRGRAGPLAHEAVTLARTAGDPDALLAALSARHVALWTPEGLNDRLAVAEEMIALAERTERPEQELQGRNWLCADLWEAGEIERFERETDEHGRLAARLRLATYGWYEPLWQAALAALRADWDRAQDLVAEAEETGGRAGDRNAPLFASGLRLAMRLARHEFAAEDLALAERHVRESPASSAWRCLRCWFAAQAGNREQANADLDWLAADEFARLPRDANWLPALFELTEAVCLLGDRTRAQQMHRLILPFRDQHISAMRGTVSWGSAECTLGRLAGAAGDLDQASRHYERALALERRWSARAWLVRTRVRYAELLIVRDAPGDREAATDLAREAVAQARAVKLSPGAVPEPVTRLAETALQRS